MKKALIPLLSLLPALVLSSANTTTLDASQPIYLGEVFLPPSMSFLAWTPSEDNYLLEWCSKATEVMENQIFTLGGVADLQMRGYFSEQAIITRRRKPYAKCFVTPESTRIGSCEGNHSPDCDNGQKFTGGHSGFPEVLGHSSGIPSPPSSPPLAARTSANELALISKNNNSTRKRDVDGRRIGRKEGAAYTIREECERLFCETMKTVFLGEEGYTANNGSIVMGANTHSPPDDSVSAYSYYNKTRPGHVVDAWFEIWDYAGGSSFRGFVGGNGNQKSLFAFFDSTVISQDLKQGLMALIELAETVFALSQVVISLDRTVPEADRKALMKNLRWVGFELITLDTWAQDLDVTSDKWLFLGMEI